MSTAASLGISTVDIPESWRLPSEGSESDKRIKVLEAEVSRLKLQEPQFKLRFLNDEGEEVEALGIELTRYAALSKEEVERLMQRRPTELASPP